MSALTVLVSRFTHSLPQTPSRVMKTVRRTRVATRNGTGRGTKLQELLVVRLDDDGPVQVADRPHRCYHAFEADRQHARRDVRGLLWYLLVTDCSVARRQEGQLCIAQHRIHQVRQSKGFVVKLDGAQSRVAWVLRAMTCEVHPRVVVDGGKSRLECPLLVLEESVPTSLEERTDACTLMAYIRKRFQMRSWGVRLCDDEHVWGGVMRADFCEMAQ